MRGRVSQNSLRRADEGNLVFGVENMPGHKVGDSMKCGGYKYSYAGMTDGGSSPRDRNSCLTLNPKGLF